MGDSAASMDPLDAAAVRKVMEGVWVDIPVSRAQCEQGWMELCSFVDAGEEVGCWRPSARARLGVWRRLVEGAVLQGIDLEKQFLVGDLWNSVLDEDDAAEPPFPRALLEAVVRRICVVDERPALADEVKCELLGWAQCVLVAGC